MSRADSHMLLTDSGLRVSHLILGSLVLDIAHARTPDSESPI